MKVVLCSWMKRFEKEERTRPQRWSDSFQMFTFSESARVCHVTSTHTNVRSSAAVSCVWFLFPEAAMLLLTFRPSGWFTRDSRCQIWCLSEKPPHQGFSVSEWPWLAEVYTKVSFFRKILCIYCLFVVSYWSEMVGYTIGVWYIAVSKQFLSPKRKQRFWTAWNMSWVWN